MLSWCFILMSTIIFCNLNGFFYLVLGVGAPFSPLLLVLSFAMLYLGVIKGKVRLDSFLLKLILLFYILYIFLGVCSYLFNPDFITYDTSLLGLLRSYLSSLPIIISFYIGSKNLILKGKVDFLIRMILFLTLFSALFIALSQIIGLTKIYAYATEVTTNADRPTGLFGNPNEAGAFGVYFLVIVLGSYSYFKKHYLLILGLVPLAFYVTFLSFSRTSMVLSVFTLFVYIIYNFRVVKRIQFGNSFKPMIFALLVFVASIIITQQAYSYFETLSHGQQTRILLTFKLFSGQVDNTTTSERSDLFAFAWQEIKKRPVIGHGIGAFHRIKYLPSDTKKGAHNTHLMIFGESGIIPLALFFLTFIILAYLGWIHDFPSLGFIIVGVCIVYFLNVSGSGHNALDDRTSNALVAIAIALSQVKKQRI